VAIVIPEANELNSKNKIEVIRVDFGRRSPFSSRYGTRIGEAATGAAFWCALSGTVYIGISEGGVETLQFRAIRSKKKRKVSAERKIKELVYSNLQG
jgi:hypothetical protein